MQNESTPITETVYEQYTKKLENETKKFLASLTNNTVPAKTVFNTFPELQAKLEGSGIFATTWHLEACESQDNNGTILLVFEIDTGKTGKVIKKLISFIRSEALQPVWTTTRNAYEATYPQNMGVAAIVASVFVIMLIRRRNKSQTIRKIR